MYNIIHVFYIYNRTNVHVLLLFILLISKYSNRAYYILTHNLL